MALWAISSMALRFMIKREIVAQMTTAQRKYRVWCKAGVQHFTAPRARNRPEIGKLIMKYIAVFLFIFAVLASSVVSAFDPEPQFFVSAQDVPLMQGLEEIEDEALLFDKPEGRIIESVALMNEVSEKAALDFYGETLPQFGWGEVGSGKFFRKNEFLEISFREIDGDKFIKIMIKPAL